MRLNNVFNNGNFIAVCEVLVEKTLNKRKFSFPVSLYILTGISAKKEKKRMKFNNLAYILTGIPFKTHAS
jgi:hypothetical protein